MTLDDRLALRSFLLELDDAHSNTLSQLNLSLGENETAFQMSREDYLTHLRPILSQLSEESPTPSDNGRSLDERLAAAGLSGAPLRLKLQYFSVALQNASWDLIDPRGRRLSSRGAGRSERRRARRFRRRLLRVFRWANIILGSAINVFPGLEPMKEFKEMFEALFQDEEDAEA
ncbi:MAG: hypothetical protein WD556_13395 [Actinomycetota bacterium]